MIGMCCTQCNFVGHGIMLPGGWPAVYDANHFQAIED